MRSNTLIQEQFYFRARDTLREFVSADPTSIQPTFEGRARQLTIEENILARLSAQHLWGETLDSCSGLELEAGYQKFKVARFSRRLVKVPKGCNLPFLPSDFNAAKGKVLSRAAGIYNKPLKEPEFLQHKGWYEVLFQDSELMRTIASVAYPLLRSLGQDSGFAFYLPEIMPGEERLFERDQLRPLYLGKISSDSPAHLNCTHFASRCCLLAVSDRTSLGNIANLFR